MLELLRILLLTLTALLHERHDLVVENLLRRHQLQVALRSRPRPHFKTRDRFFWLVVRWLFPAWRRHLVLVRPETVLRWHRRGWRLYWRWRSGRHLGRPRLSPEIRELIATMASHNPLWGAERIRGRAPQARYRRQLPLDPPLSSTSSLPPTQPELAHLPCQPCSLDLGRRPLCRPDPDVPDPLRPLLH